MTPFDRILFPVDFSEAAEAMVQDVSTMARRFEASVTVLHAFDEVREHDLAPRVDAPFGPEPGAVPYTPELKQLRAARQERLGEFVREHFSQSGIQARALLEDGDPAKAIEWAAKQEQAALVMMATQGKGALRQMLLGSLTARLLHDLDCPLYTSPHEQGERPRSPDRFRTILCAARTAAESELALKMAGLLAQAFGSRVCLLHVRAGGEDQDAEENAAGVQEAFEKALGAEGGVAARVRIADAEVPEAVRQTAMEESADLVVVGRGRARTGVSRIRSNLYTLIRESPCPVLSV
jgi:nucleotide-binding universal stress UspA family protein